VPPGTPAPLGCPRRGTPFSRRVAQFILALGGWRIEGDLPDEPRFVLIAAPHTSNWDFPIAILSMFGFGLRMNWLGKHTLFRFPITGLMHWMGGEPIDRSATKGFVEEAIERFRQRPQWVLGISPEGTRKRAGAWKTGFHRIALGAGVPIVPVTIDYSRRVLGIHPPFFPTADFQADEQILRQSFRKEMARIPGNYADTSEAP
jgi:1-acyl-sn-glycerol-3-phosphate acyltransferase